MATTCVVDFYISKEEVVNNCRIEYIFIPPSEKAWLIEKLQAFAVELSQMRADGVDGEFARIDPPIAVDAQGKNTGSTVWYGLELDMQRFSAVYSEYNFYVSCSVDSYTSYYRFHGGKCKDAKRDQVYLNSGTDQFYYFVTTEQRAKESTFSALYSNTAIKKFTLGENTKNFQKFAFKLFNEDQDYQANHLVDTESSFFIHFFIKLNHQKKITEFCAKYYTPEKLKMILSAMQYSMQQPKYQQFLAEDKKHKEILLKNYQALFTLITDAITAESGLMLVSVPKKYDLSLLINAT